MRIIQCESISYCGGVRRAVRMAEDCLSSGVRPLYSLGALIHNPDTCRDLEKRGLVIIDSPEGHERGTLIIRAHGVPEESRRQFLDAGFTLLDATCPIVQRNLRRIRDFSAERRILIIGDCNHDEVKAMSHVEGVEATVISSVSDLSSLDAALSYAVFVQTTFPSDLYREIRGEIVSRGFDAVFGNRICPSSVARRRAVSSLADQCDAVLIIGGRNSANTRALYDLVRGKGRKCWLIENESEVREEMKSVSRLGLASGSSTSLSMIERVRKKLEE